MSDLGSIERSSDDGVAVIVLTGEFDLSNVGELVTTLESLAPAPGHRRPVIVDLGATRYIDSTVMNAFVFARSHGLDLRLRRLNGNPRRVIEIAGLLDLFAIDE